MDRRLWWGLGVAGGLSVLAAAQPDNAPAKDVVLAAPRQQAVRPAQTEQTVKPVASASASPASAEVAAPGRGAWPPLGREAALAWRAPAPVLPPPAPPPAPLPPAPPPPFPYQWLGQLDDDSGTRYFLAGPQRTLTLKPGDAIDRRWRLEGVRDGRLQLTWLASGAAIELAPR